VANKSLGVDELKGATLHIIVERFAGRQLTWETATMALSLTAFEVKQAALFRGSNRQ